MMTILLALLALVGIALLVLHYGRRSPASHEAEAQVAVSPAETLQDRAPRHPPAATEAGPNDPDATQIYMRPGPSTGTAVSRGGDGKILSHSAGACLVGLNGKQKGLHIPIPANGLTIGRSSSCGLVLTDACVSGQHAWVGIVDGKAILRDLKSTNGTFLNAHLHSPISEAELRAGDTLFIGGHLGEQFRFEVD